MKYLTALLVLGFVVSFGSSAFAQDAFYHYDSNAHNYRNYHYPVDGPTHYHATRPAYGYSWTGQSLVLYRPVYYHSRSYQRHYWHHSWCW